MSIQQVYDHWNSKPKHFKWKTHGKLTTKMTSAITDRLENWTVEDLCGMIDNFYTCKTDERFTINHNAKWPKWTLSMFLTRGIKEGDLRCEWFEDEEFDEERWYTDKFKEVRRTRRQQKRDFETDARDVIDKYKWMESRSDKEIQAWIDNRMHNYKRLSPFDIMALEHYKPHLSEDKLKLKTG